MNFKTNLLSNIFNTILAFSCFPYNKTVHTKKVVSVSDLNGVTHNNSHLAKQFTHNLFLKPRLNDDFDDWIKLAYWLTNIGNGNLKFFIF